LYKNNNTKQQCTSTITYAITNLDSQLKELRVAKNDRTERNAISIHAGMNNYNGATYSEIFVTSEKDNHRTSCSISLKKKRQ
jgi:hypothetical protein